MQPTVPIRILLVDDQPLFRRAIATLIGEAIARTAAEESVSSLFD